MQTAGRPVPTESQEQQALFDWARAECGRWPELKLMYHVPNEGKRSAATGRKLRAEGLRAGVPDVVLPVARGGQHGLYIEMKRTQGGRVSPAQAEWIEALAAQGYRAVICRGLDAARREILRYLNDEPTRKTDEED